MLSCLSVFDNKNKIRKDIFWTVILLFLSFVKIGFCGDFSGLPDFTDRDRVLVLAPHPDDEAIGAGGVIQRALKAGAPVKVVCFTNGDNNELAFIVYEKRLTFKQKEFLHMGEVRRKETIAAMESLGLSPGRVFTLGYPDFGTMEILTKYWDKTRPFKSMFSRVKKVSYPSSLSYQAPFIGQSILTDLNTILLDFRPTKIFVSHPADRNRDHQALYLFLHIALWDLEGKIKQPQVYPYLIHVPGWPKPRGAHTELFITPPSKLKGIDWKQFLLTSNEAEAKRKAIMFYKSQNVAAPSYLATFARSNELFSDPDVIKLHTIKKDAKIDWQEVVAPEDIEEYGNAGAPKDKAEELLTSLAYALTEDDLCLRFNLKKKIDNNFGIKISLLGYSRKKDFAIMPKIAISINALGLRTQEKGRAFKIEGLRRVFEGKALIIKIPRKSLGDPEKVLSCVKTRAKGLLLDETAWRIIELK